jgi:PTH1 family peptidyl-tRNA hydrolase
VTQAHLQSFLFVGLGNPGPQYEMTRHNMGYLVVQAFAKHQSWSFKEDRRFNARVAKGISENKTVHLVLPLTYMNLSGITVRRYMDYFKLPLNHLVVITDDIALAFGQQRLRAMGSAGGHNGLRSLESHLGTSHFTRLRMGIGHPGQKGLADYVLDSFSPTEQQELPTFIDRGVEILQRLLKENLSHVMNAVNTVSRQIKQEPFIGPESIDLTKPLP